jgi:hypothetical protein
MLAKRLSQVEAWDPEAISVFSTRNQTSKTDNYFLDSASDVGFFFEEKALDEGGKLVKPKNRAINKIGHGALKAACFIFCPVFAYYSSLIAWLPAHVSASLSTY